MHAPTPPTSPTSAASPVSRLQALLDIRHPLLLAPMAAISGGALAQAVSDAGALGLIGGGYGDEAGLRRELALVDGPRVGVGFITWALERQPRLLDLVLEHQVKAVFLSFGSIGRFAPQVKAGGAVLIAQVQTVAQALAAAGEGADILVAQGTEAGGHGGARATLPLVPAVIDAVPSLPVVAAGGIADGRGLAAALALGAAGAVCGTVFYASTEALAHPGAKARLVQASGDDTLRSSLFDKVRGIDWPADWNLRTLRNAFSARWEGDAAGLQAAIGAEQARFVAARDAGDFDTAAVIAGEAADLVRGVEPAAAIVQRIMQGAAPALRAALAGLPAND